MLLRDYITVRKEPNPRKGENYPRWVAQWRFKGKVKTVYLGSCARMTEAEAMEKAQRLKVLDLGIDVAEIPVTGKG
jgi:hypothetical protein